MDTGDLKIGSCEEFNGKEWERGDDFKKFFLLFLGFELDPI